MTDVLARAKEIEEDIIRLRRRLHQFPELSLEEHQTQATIIGELEQLGIPYQRIANTSTLATIVGGKPGPTLALRADIDALPMLEENDLPYRSQNPGVMHACGHDAHTAMLLGAARLLVGQREALAGNVRLIFQEAEEVGTGARAVISSGGLEGVDAIFGMHAMASLNTGEVSFQPGYITAGSDTITVRFVGAGGHGSTPHLGRDTIHPAAQFVTQLQAIVTKHSNALDPLVLSVGQIHGGTKANIIARETELELTMRFFDMETRDIIHEAIQRHAAAVADAFEIRADVDIRKGSPSVTSDPELAALVDRSSIRALGEGKNIVLDPIMASDDMAYYLQEIPGVYGSIGYRNEEVGAIYPPHHDNYLLDEAFMKYGVAMHTQVAMDYLEAGKET